MTGLEIVGTFRDYDAMVPVIRARIAELGLSYADVDRLAGLAGGHTGKLLGDARVKQFGLYSFLRMTETVGLRGALFVDQALVEEMRRHWSKCDTAQKRASRKAPLGKATLARVFPVVVREMQKRGVDVRSRNLTPAQRSAIARKAGKASGRARLRKGLREHGL
jgi:hypothetical protein